MRFVVVSALAAVALAGCSRGGGDDRGTRANVDYVSDFVYFGLVYVGDVPSGQVAIQQRGDRTRVAITYPSPERFPADIRRGTCDSVDSIGRRAISALAPLDDHRSETLVELSVDELRNREYVVVVRDGGRSLPAQGIIACSELGIARRP